MRAYGFGFRVSGSKLTLNKVRTQGHKTISCTYGQSLGAIQATCTASITRIRYVNVRQFSLCAVLYGPFIQPKRATLPRASTVCDLVVCSRGHGDGLFAGSTVQSSGTTVSLGFNVDRSESRD